MTVKLSKCPACGKQLPTRYAGDNRGIVMIYHTLKGTGRVCSGTGYPPKKEKKGS